VRASVPLLLAILLAAPAHAEEPGPEARAFVEIRVVGNPPVAGEAVTLRLRVGFDRAWFGKHAAPLFRQTLDVPLQVNAPWLSKPDGAVRLSDPAPTRARQTEHMTLVLDGDVVTAARLTDETRGDLTFTVLHLDRRYLFSKPADVTVPAPTLRFAHAERFEEGFVGDRVAIDPVFVALAGEPLRVAVEPLPGADRPAEFDGAVGSYAVHAETRAAEVAVGEAFELAVEFVGRGSLEQLPTPTLHGLDGFRVQGSRDDHRPYDRRVVYEVAAVRDDVTAVPALRFAFFDPTRSPGVYRIARTEPIPLRVRPAPVRAPGQAPAGDDPPWTFAALGALAGAAAMLLVCRRRAPPRVEVSAAMPATRATRIEAARAALEAHPDERSLVAFLAAHLDRAPSAVLGPGLVARLEAIGLARDLGERTARMLESVVAARYGGAPASLDRALLRELQDALTT